MKTVALGGKNRVGSGNKIKTNLREFERSTFDVSSTLKTTVSAGTLVPIWQDVALPGTTHDIQIYLDMLTAPTIGALYGSFKAQADVYSIPVRLYQAQMHNNKNGIGLHMEDIKFPFVRVCVPNPRSTDYDNIDLDNYQVNPSHVLSYTNDFRGAGIKIQPEGDGVAIVQRDINATSYIGYYDIGKNFYCNKQEGIGYIVHSEPIGEDTVFLGAAIFGYNDGVPPLAELGLTQIGVDDTPTVTIGVSIPSDGHLEFVIGQTAPPFDIVPDIVSPDQIELWLTKPEGPLPAETRWYRITELFEEIVWEWTEVSQNYQLHCTVPTEIAMTGAWGAGNYRYNIGSTGETAPRLTEFPLSDVDDLREDILSRIKDASPYMLQYEDGTSNIPNTSVFKRPLKYTLDSNGRILSSALNQDQDGLMVGTYMSDVFNNWLDSENVGLADTLSAIKVQNVEGQDLIYVNEISLKTKVWELFNAINTMGGSLIDYYDAVYDHDVFMGTYSPIYCGGISKELRFQQILSTVGTEKDPLGTIAGRGVMSQGQKGGNVTIKTNEPSVIMVIFKLTPRLDYSQGNWWFNNVKTMADFHNPYMDRIGFQDLITDKMAWWDTEILGGWNAMTTKWRSAGKQTAWIDYQTNYNRVKGNFAKKNNAMYMVIARNYKPKLGGATPTIADLTTYIDPANTNFIFADTELTAMNFQLEANIQAKARRKMSSKTQPIQ